MPKIVDHRKQKEKVAEAVWRVILKEGIEKATVRNIAKEAGLPVSTMRHYFRNQSELLHFSMMLILERIEQRVEKKLSKGLQRTQVSPLEAAKRIAKFFIHLGEDEKAEMKVWLVFTVKSFSDESLHKLSDEMYKDLYNAMEFVIGILQKGGVAKPDLDVKLEVERLYALVDGLALHRIMKPDLLTEEQIDAILMRHLKSLCIRQVL